MCCGVKRVNENIYAVLKRGGFGKQLETDCLVTPDDERFSYGNVDRLSAQFAAALAELGAQPGDRIVAQVDKSPAALALYLGVVRMGAVFVPLNTAYTSAEVEYFLKDTEARVFICTSARLAECETTAQSAGVDTVVSLDAESVSPWQRKVEAMTPADEIVVRESKDLAALVYTSGTTGRSKGAMISHGALSSNARALHAIWGFEPGDVLLHALPIFHIHGLFISLNPALLNGSTILFLPRFEVAAVRRLLPEATVMMGVPTFYSRLLAEPDFGRADCAHMRVFISGSAPLTEATSHEWADRTGHRILERYGMTEAGIITSNPLDGERIAGTVGFPLPDVEVRVCDGDGKAVPRGEVGTLEVRGPNLFSGYWREPEKTAEEFRPDGFFITGDLAAQDESDRVSIVGRAKDLIISGGYNIYPKEIESVLDGLHSVKESAVVGVPHVDLGEGVVAVLVAAGEPCSDAVLQRWLNEKLARFKHPRRFYWIEELPRNAMGKVQKNLLVEKYRDAYQ